MHFAKNENHFQTKVFVFNRGQPSDINSGHTPIIYFMDNPLIYMSIGQSPTIDIIWTTLRYISIGQTPTIDIVRPEKFQFMEKGQNRNFDYKIVISVKNP